MVRLRFQRRRAQNGRLRILVIRNDPTMVVRVGGIILQKKHTKMPKQFQFRNSNAVILPGSLVRTEAPVLLFPVLRPITHAIYLPVYQLMFLALTQDYILLPKRQGKIVLGAWHGLCHINWQVTSFCAMGKHNTSRQVTCDKSSQPLARPSNPVDGVSKGQFNPVAAG